MNSLGTTIRRGLSLVQTDAAGHLGVAFRCGLYAQLENLNTEPSVLWRVRLASSAVRKVIPLWEENFKDDHSPHEAIILVENLLAKKLSQEVAARQLGQLWSHCDNLAWRFPEKQCAVAVGYATAQVIREALSPSHFGCDQLGAESDDVDVDPYDHDSAFLASIAYAGGAPWESRGDAQKRRAFWTWWLTDCIHRSN